MPKYAILAGTLSSSPGNAADFPADLTRIYRASPPHITSGEAFDVGDASMTYIDGVATSGVRWPDVYYAAIGKNDGSQFFGSDPKIAIPFLVADILLPIVPTYSKKLQLEVISGFDNLRSLGFLANYVEKNIQTDPAFLEKFNEKLRKACLNHTKYNSISLSVKPGTFELYLSIDEKAPPPAPPKSFYDKVKSAWGGFQKNILAPLWVITIIDIMVFWFGFIFRALLTGSYTSGIQIAGSIAGSVALTTVFPALLGLSYLALKMRNWVEHNRLTTDENKDSTWWKKIDKALFSVQWYGFKVQWKNWPGPTKLIPAIGKFFEATLNMAKILTFDLVRYTVGFFVMTVVAPSVAWKNRQIRNAQALNPNSITPEQVLAYDDPKTQELGHLIQKAKCALDFSKIETEDSKPKTHPLIEPDSPRVRRLSSLDIKAIKHSEDSEFDWDKLDAFQKKYKNALHLIGPSQNGEDWRKQVQHFLATYQVSSTLSFLTAASSAWLVLLYLTWQYDDALIIAGNPLSQDAYYAIGLTLLIMSALIALDTALNNKRTLESAKQSAASILQKINAEWEKLDVEQIRANKNIPVFSHLAYLDEMSRERSFETWMKRGLLAFGGISGVTMFRVATVPGMMNFLPYVQAHELDYRLFFGLAAASGVLWCTIKIIESFYKDNKKAAQRYIEHGEQYIDYLSNLAKVFPKPHAAETLEENKERSTLEQSSERSPSQGELLGLQLSQDLHLGDHQPLKEKDPLSPESEVVYQS